MPKMPLDQVNYQSTLLKAGIRFDFNVVDTVCRHKLGWSFYLVLLVLVCILAFPEVLRPNIDPSTVQKRYSTLHVFILALLFAYEFICILRLCYYIYVRSQLRKDPAPIAVEAYTVVCLDVKRTPNDYLLTLLLGKKREALCGYAVIYKELGTAQPRFFLTARVSAHKLCFVPEHVGRVFIHRQKPYLYTLDDKSAYQTVSAKQKLQLRGGLVGLKGDCAASPSNEQHQGTMRH